MGFILVSLIILLFPTSMVSGFTLELYHRSHPNISHHWDTTYLNDPYQANISNKEEYVIHFSIGTPPFKTFAVFDTGSDLFWMQTSTCHRCMPQPPETLYDVTRSSTFEIQPCNTSTCTAKDKYNNRCDIEPVGCPYKYSYMDNSTSSGYLATELITFTDGTKRGRSQVRLLMGVGTHNFGIFHQGRELMSAPGIFGIAYSGRQQLTRNFETDVFSYCIPADKNKVGYVKFGKISEFLGPSVSLVENVPSYKLRLTGVSLNDKRLDDGNGLKSWEGFTMILDTGTPISRFHPDVLDSLQIELEEMFDVSFSTENYNLCWDNVDSEVIEKMTVTLHFGDIDFQLYKPQLWTKVGIVSGDTTLLLDCVSVMASNDEHGLVHMESILGTTQSTNKNIAINVLLGTAAIEDRYC